jgi:hypothetical protein
MSKANSIQQAKESFDKSFFVPRAISENEISLDESCSMIGFLGMSDALQRTYIKVHSPSNPACYSKSTGSYCSITFFDVDKCGGNLGSPVFDRSDTELIKGIVIFDRFCKNGQKGVTSIHSISEYRDWIIETSGAFTAISLSPLLAFPLALVLRSVLN